MWVVDRIVGGLVGGVRGREKEDAKTRFLGARTVYVHYFKNIRQGALQFDCVMLLREGQGAFW